MSSPNPRFNCNPTRAQRAEWDTEQQFLAEIDPANWGSMAKYANEMIELGRSVFWNQSSNPEPARHPIRRRVRVHRDTEEVAASIEDSEQMPDDVPEDHDLPADDLDEDDLLGEDEFDGDADPIDRKEIAQLRVAFNAAAPLHLPADSFQINFVTAPSILSSPTPKSRAESDFGGERGGSERHIEGRGEVLEWIAGK